MNKKKVGFIDRTEATCSYTEHQLAGFSGKYVGITVWYLSHAIVSLDAYKVMDKFGYSMQCRR